MESAHRDHSEKVYWHADGPIEIEDLASDGHSTSTIVMTKHRLGIYVETTRSVDSQNGDDLVETENCEQLEIEDVVKVVVGKRHAETIADPENESGHSTDESHDDVSGPLTRKMHQLGEGAVDSSQKHLDGDDLEADDGNGHGEVEDVRAETMDHRRVQFGQKGEWQMEPEGLADFSRQI